MGYTAQIDTMIEKDKGLRTRDCDVRDCIIPFCLEYCLGCFGSGIWGVLTVNKLAERTNVVRSAPRDFLAWCFCTPCATVQTRRHADGFGLPTPGCSFLAKN